MSDFKWNYVKEVGNPQILDIEERIEVTRKKARESYVIRCGNQDKERMEEEIEESVKKIKEKYIVCHHPLGQPNEECIEFMFFYPVANRWGKGKGFLKTYDVYAWAEIPAIIKDKYAIEREMAEKRKKIDELQAQINKLQKEIEE